mgnify:CR=1 FL=1
MLIYIEAIVLSIAVGRATPSFLNMTNWADISSVTTSSPLPCVGYANHCIASLSKSGTTFRVSKTSKPPSMVNFY